MTGNYDRKLWQEIMIGNYDRKLWQEIMTRNYQLVYQWRGKCGNYRDTGVSKNYILFNIRIYLVFSITKVCSWTNEQLWREKNLFGIG